MTDPIQPATDEEVRAHLERAARGAPTSESFLLALIARIDALKAERDAERARAEALDQQLTAVMAALRRDTTIMNGDNHLIAVAKAQQERAEKAEAERDRLRAALELVSLRQESDGPCWCAVRAGPHHITCLRARALLGEVKP